MCSFATDEPANLELAQMIAEAWQAGFRSRELRDVVNAVTEKIAAGAKLTLSDIADIMLDMRALT
jgi:hypothetical protein